jgi:hypothetical protein
MKFDFTQFASKKPAPQPQPGDQTGSVGMGLPSLDEVRQKQYHDQTDRRAAQRAGEDAAASQARFNLLANQSTTLLTSARNLRIMLTIAVMGNEIPQATLDILFQELVACAALCQPKEGE